MAKKVNSTKDIWDKIDVIIKGFAGIMISGAIAFYGIKSTTRQTEIAESNRQAQILVQTMNHRETSASQMKTQMFKTLMEHYFKEKDDEKSEIRILDEIRILELIGLNFQDHIHLKPLFTRLDTKLKENVSERKVLRKIAKNIKRSEIDKIVGSGGDVVKHELVFNETICMKPYDLINLTLLDVKEDRIRVASKPDDREGFEVTYYDMPFMDNSRLGELTYSVLLSSVDIGNRKAKVKVVVLPKHYYSSQNNLRFDGMIGDLLEKMESE